MPIFEDMKEYMERATDLRRPGKREAADLAWTRKPAAIRFKDDGLVPNHPRWPLILYRCAIDLDDRYASAATRDGSSLSRLVTPPSCRLVLATSACLPTMTSWSSAPIRRPERTMNARPSKTGRAP